MPSLRRKLPPLTALTAFEAAARLASFTKAALELGITQAAVSRQIHALEEILGSPLFRRLHRRVELTESGRLLSASASNAFNLIADTAAEISKGAADDELTISATVAFTQFWLLPRITAFSRMHPQIKLRILTQDAPINIDNGDTDLTIRFGSGVWPDGVAEFLFHDEIFPICNSEYAREIGKVEAPQDLIRYPLITHDTADPIWTGWREWLAAFSVEAPKRLGGLHCSFYTEAIQAVLIGQGIALGWKRLVEELLAQNRLVRLTSASIMTRNAYFVVVPRRRKKKEGVERFIQWLKDVSKEAEG